MESYQIYIEKGNPRVKQEKSLDGIYKYAKYNTLENLPGARRRKRLTETEIRAIVREVKANPPSNGVKIAENCKNLWKASERKYCRKIFTSKWITRKKLFMSKINQVKRLNFVSNFWE